MKKFENGHKFRMTAVALNLKAKPEFMSTTVKQVVNLQATKTSKLLQDTTQRNPEPWVTCNECMAFKSTQAFDIVALIDAVSERRTVSTDKFVRDVRIIDGTSDSGLQHPPAACNHPPTLSALRSVFSANSPEGTDQKLVAFLSYNNLLRQLVNQNHLNSLASKLRDTSLKPCDTGARSPQRRDQGEKNSRLTINP